MLQLKLNGVYVNFEILKNNSYGEVLHFYEEVEFNNKKNELMRHFLLKFPQGCTLEELEDYVRFEDYKIAEKINMKEKREITMKRKRVEFGDDNDLLIPIEPVDCSKLGFFDELEEECWALLNKYCEMLGAEIIPIDEDDEEAISFDLAKDIQDHIIELLQSKGLELKFE